MLNELRESRKSPSVVFTEYCHQRQYLIDKGIKYCFFFEGKDDYKYYCIRIGFYIDDEDCTYFDCFGRDNILEIKKLIDNTKEKLIKSYYFIDRDFNDSYLITEDLYETPSYSIENFYIYSSTFKAILKGEFTLTEVSDDITIVNDYKNILTLYKNNLDVFLDCIEKLVCWYCIQVQKSHNVTPKPDLSNLKELKNLLVQLGICVRINLISSNYDINILKKITPNYIETTDEEINECLAKLKQRKSIISYRGKYLLCFLEKFICEIVEDANKTTNQRFFTKKRKCKLNLAGNTLSALSQYAYTPKCLKQFLNNIL